MSQTVDIAVPEQDATYLHAHHKTQSVPEMAKELKRGNKTIYEFMAALKLEPLARKISKDHPFRIANRNLEKNLLHYRIERGKENRRK